MYRQKCNREAEPTSPGSQGRTGARQRALRAAGLSLSYDVDDHSSLEARHPPETRLECERTWTVSGDVYNVYLIYIVFYIIRGPSLCYFLPAQQNRSEAFRKHPRWAVCTVPCFTGNREDLEWPSLRASNPAGGKVSGPVQFGCCFLSWLSFQPKSCGQVTIPFGVLVSRAQMGIIIAPAS